MPWWRCNKYLALFLPVQVPLEMLLEEVTLSEQEYMHSLS